MGTARADLEKAKGHVKSALAAFTLGDFPKAAAEYEAAYSEEPDPALLYNSAQAQRLAGNKPRALFLYQNYLRFFPNQSNRAEVQKHIANLTVAIETERRTQTTPPVTPKMTELEKPRPSPKPVVAEAKPVMVAKPVETKPMLVETKPAMVVTQAPPPRKKSKAWVWGVVGGAVVAVGVGLGVGLGIGLSSTSYPAAGIGSVQLH